MKTFKKNQLPEKIVHNGSTYFNNAAISAAQALNDTPLKTIAQTLKKEGRKMVIVEVSNKSLKGKNDLHGQPYKPSIFIFTTDPAL